MEQCRLADDFASIPAGWAFAVGAVVRWRSFEHADCRPLLTERPTIMRAKPARWSNARAFPALLAVSWSRAKNNSRQARSDEPKAGVNQSSRSKRSAAQFRDSTTTVTSVYCTYILPIFNCSCSLFTDHCTRVETLLERFVKITLSVERLVSFTFSLLLFILASVWLFNVELNYTEIALYTPNTGHYFKIPVDDLLPATMTHTITRSWLWSYVWCSKI